MFQKVLCLGNSQFVLPLCTMESENKVLYVELLKADRLKSQQKQVMLGDPSRYYFIADDFKMYVDINTAKVIDRNFFLTLSPYKRRLINSNDYKNIMFQIAKRKLNSISNSFSVNNIVDTVRFAYWTEKKYNIEISQKERYFKQYSVVWVNLGHNLGVELRKFRPCIIWNSINKENCIVIPLTSSFQCLNHTNYQMTTPQLTSSFVRVDEMRNISSKRIAGIYSQGIFINAADKQKINDLIKKEYNIN